MSCISHKLRKSISRVDVHVELGVGPDAGGIDLDEDGLTTIARRNRNLVRAINNRRGMRRKDEKPPQDHWKRRFPELEARLMDTYYRFRGWNREGIPTAESLRELGLDYVLEDFLERGILTAGGDDAPAAGEPSGTEQSGGDEP